LCLTNELRALFQIVHHRDLSICVAAVHERKLDRRTRVTAVLHIERVIRVKLLLTQNLLTMRTNKVHPGAIQVTR
jgi:hypothetical protein